MVVGRVVEELVWGGGGFREKEVWASRTACSVGLVEGRNWKRSWLECVRGVRWWVGRFRDGGVGLATWYLG